MQNNDLAQFKTYLDGSNGQVIKENTSAIKYGYDLDLQIYKADTADGITQVNPSPLLESDGIESKLPVSSVKESVGMSSDIWTEMLENKELLSSQYDILAGAWPKAFNEVVILVNENNEISDMTLYALGLKDTAEFEEIQKKIEAGEEVERADYKEATFTYDDLLNLEFKLLDNTAYYEKADGVWVDKRNNETFMKAALENATTIKITGILRPSEEAAAASIGGTIGYTSELTQYMVKRVNDSEIVKEQKKNPDVNVFTGSDFIVADNMSNEELLATIPADRKAQLMAMPEAERTTYLASYQQTLAATYDSNLEKLGVVDLEKPSAVNLYLKDFDSREAVTQAIEDYNRQQKDAGHDEYVIEYTDMVGIMTASITNIIDMITYLLIGFVSISLVVSSIMIGIITYISVLERTKEIGILRSIGASKRDISRVFNAETTIVGLAAGLIGIGLTLLLSLIHI